MANFATTSYGISRTGKPLNVGDSVSISGVITAISGTGAGANITVQCAGATNGPLDTTTGAYSYSIGIPLGGGTNAPATGVYAADCTSVQTL
jgi:hypothetical protein